MKAGIGSQLVFAARGWRFGRFGGVGVKLAGAALVNPWCIASRWNGEDPQSGLRFDVSRRRGGTMK